MTQYYVHYTVQNPPAREAQKMVAGPYSVQEVVDQRRDIASYAYVTEAHVSDKPKE